MENWRADGGGVGAEEEVACVGGEDDGCVGFGEDGSACDALFAGGDVVCFWRMRSRLNMRS